MIRRYLTLLFFLLVVVGGGLFIGASNVPGGWYAQLVKPWFNPPNWLFAPAWTVLYILIAFAGWMTFQEDGRIWGKALWAVQLMLNFLWSPVFFSLHQIGAALAVVILLWMAVVAFILVQRARQPASSALFIPYVLWVSYAAALNAAILRLNG